MTITFSCPHCGCQIRFSESAAGHIAKCAECHKPVEVPPPESTDAIREYDEPSALQGRLVACPKCGYQVTREAYACTNCGRRLKRLPVKWVAIWLAWLFGITALVAVVFLVIRAIVSPVR